jgi:hypothetical protein
MMEDECGHDRLLLREMIREAPQVDGMAVN